MSRISQGKLQDTKPSTIVAATTKLDVLKAEVTEHWRDHGCAVCMNAVHCNFVTREPVILLMHDDQDRNQRTALLACCEENMPHPEVHVFWGEEPVVSMLAELAVRPNEEGLIASMRGVNFRFWQGKSK
jgi:hypothetical protein